MSSSAPQGFNPNPSELEEIAGQVASLQSRLDAVELGLPAHRHLASQGAPPPSSALMTELADVEAELDAVGRALPHVVDGLAGDHLQSDFLVQQLADARQQLEAIKVRAPAPFLFFYYCFWAVGESSAGVFVLTDLAVL